MKSPPTSVSSLTTEKKPPQEHCINHSQFELDALKVFPEENNLLKNEVIMQENCAV
jgi:hypothetical protein